MNACVPVVRLSLVHRNVELAQLKTVIATRDGINGIMASDGKVEKGETVDGGRIGTAA